MQNDAMNIENTKMESRFKSRSCLIVGAKCIICPKDNGGCDSYSDCCDSDVGVDLTGSCW